MEKEKHFYDLHCHALNLSHPNLLAFVRQVKFPTMLAVGAYLLLGPVLPLIVANYLGRKKVIRRMKNLLSVMENDVGSLFLLMDECLRSGEDPIYQNGQLRIGGNTYHKMILTPLMMDFGYKNMLYSDLHYKKPPEKPIVCQVVDVFNGIKRYHRETQGQGIFEIYPFLGINPANYRLDQVEKMLDKYFGDYTGSMRDLQANFGQFTGDIEEMSSHFFAGIKVYPPLGFDPWPEDLKERMKLECLYEYASSKQIPITTHCSDGGFVIVEKKTLKRYQDPARWFDVLEQYPELKLNLAHFGHPKKWVEPVVKMLLSYPNVYADLSYLGHEDQYYKKIRKMIDQIPEIEARERLKDHLIFGSDFMMQLLHVDSYSQYLQIYSKTQHISTGDKDRFGSRNASGFLFNGNESCREDLVLEEEGLEVGELSLV